MIKEGDRVYNPITESCGTIERIYPEIDMAIVCTKDGSEKVRLNDIVPLRLEAKKRETLLDKIKGKFF